MSELQQYLDGQRIVFRPRNKISLRSKVEASRYYKLLRARSWRKLLNLLHSELLRFFDCERVSSKPYFLSLEPTNACQLRCPFCMGGTLPEISSLRLEDYRSLMRKLGPWLIRAELYKGGEPFLHPDILEMIRIAKSYGVDVSISSNLQRLPQDDAESLVASGLDSLLVSLDGISQESYAKYRRGGDVEAVFRNMKAVLAARRRQGAYWPRVVWQFLVFKHNEHEVKPAVELAKEIGVDQIIIKGGYVPPEPELLKEWKMTIPDIWDFKGCSEDKTCLWPWGGVNVYADGTVSLCYIDEKQYCRAGDLERDFDGLWNGEYFRRARRAVARLRKGAAKPDYGAKLMCEKCHAFGSVNFWV